MDLFVQEREKMREREERRGWRKREERGEGVQQRMGEDPAVPLPTLRRRVPMQGHGAVAWRPRRQLRHAPLGTFSGSGRQREHLDSANSTCSSGKICRYTTSRFAEACAAYGEGLHKGEAGNAVLLCNRVQNAVLLFCLRRSSSMEELGSMMVSLLQQSQPQVTAMDAEGARCHGLEERERRPLDPAVARIRPAHPVPGLPLRRAALDNLLEVPHVSSSVQDTEDERDLLDLFM